MRRLAALVVAVGVLGGGPAVAAESAYTPIKLEACQEGPLDPNDPLLSGVFDCPGYGGMRVKVVEADLRFLISYAPGVEDPISSHQTLPPFNTIGDTLEWRLGETGQPYATILRYFVDAPAQVGGEQQILVVTKLADGDSCHVAYVNASANANANLLARQAADALSPMFRCEIDSPVWFGDGEGF